MARHAFQRPLFSFGISLIGLGLLFSGFGFLTSSSFAALAQQTTTCNAPEVTASKGYRTLWTVRQWLVFDRNGANDTIPIGPAKWRVDGRVKDGTGKSTCFSEDWSANTFVKASSRGNDRGRIYTRQEVESDDSIGFQTPDIRQAGECIKYGKKFFVGPETCLESYENRTDAAFDNNGAWDPVGLYGLLRDSENDLSQSHSYFPIEWEVIGNFVE